MTQFRHGRDQRTYSVQDVEISLVEAHFSSYSKERKQSNNLVDCFLDSANWMRKDALLYIFVYMCIYVRESEREEKEGGGE